MSDLIDKIAQLFQSPYLTYWYLVFFGGYLLTYGIAYFLADRGHREDGTLIYHCRTAWAKAFLFHALIGAIVAYFWWSQNSSLLSLWRYFPFYLGPIVVDVVMALVLLIGRAKYHQYTDDNA